MAFQEQHDLREYHITTSPLAVHTTGTIAHIPIPASGQVIRAIAACDTAGDSDENITFELGGVALTSGGTTATMVCQNADVVGDIQTIEFDPNAKTNLALEPADGDAIAAGGTLEIISGGAGTAGAYIFVITIRP